MYAKDEQVMVKMGQITMPLRDQHYKEIFKRKPRNELEARQFALRLRKMRRPLDFPSIQTAGGRRSRKEELARRRRRRSGIVKVEMNDIQMEDDREFPTMKECIAAAVNNKSAVVERDYDVDKDKLNLKFNVGGKRTRVDATGQKTAGEHIAKIMEELGIKEGSKVTFTDQS